MTDDAEPVEADETVLSTWNEEYWLLFAWLVREWPPEYEALLRQQCAIGHIRTIRSDDPDPYYPFAWIIRASEWINGKPDGAYIWVHMEDLKAWGKAAQIPLPAVGKVPRIKHQLARLYPDGVPDPAFAPRTQLRADLIQRDHVLRGLDFKTLKKAVEQYNRELSLKRTA
jgi:hypothetical protein